MRCSTSPARTPKNATSSRSTTSIRSTVDLIRRTNAHKGVELVDTYDDDGALGQREREPAEADLPQPDRERTPGDAERRHACASTSAATAAT